MTHTSDSACQCGKAGKRILFVDDERDYCELILLMSEGYDLNIDVQSSLLEAVEILHLYDILVTDLDFTHEGPRGGLLLAKSFRVIQPSGVVILITGHHLIEVGDDVDFSFTKPIMFDELIQALVKAVELFDSKNANAQQGEDNGTESQRKNAGPSSGL